MPKQGREPPLVELKRRWLYTQTVRLLIMRGFLDNGIPVNPDNIGGAAEMVCGPDGAGGLLLCLKAS
jgi:hypothetical protein